MQDFPSLNCQLEKMNLGPQKVFSDVSLFANTSRYWFLKLQNYRNSVWSSKFIF